MRRSIMGALVIALAAWPAVAFADTFYTANLNGAQVAPPTASMAIGFGRVRLNSAENQIVVSVYYWDHGSVTGGHIHGPAPAGMNAGVLFDLNPTSGGGAGVVVNRVFGVTPTEVGQLKSGLWYFDIHTAAFPGGELRGQLQLDSPFLTTLSSAQTVPMNASTATGRAWVSLNAAGTYALVSIDFTGLSGNATAAHLHGLARPGVTAPILCNPAVPTATGGSSVDVLCFLFPGQATGLRQGQMYVDVHAFLSAGEIRGQLTRGFNPCDFDGDGKSDATVVRNDVSSGSLHWWIQLSASGAVQFHQFGATGDFNSTRILCGDYDGDGKADPTVWRTGAQSIFYSLLSSTGQMRATQFGTATDDPRIVGDYDSDGRDDIAVYRPGAQSIFYILESSTNALRAVPWGTTGDFNQTSPDYDGDGRTDFAVQRPGVPAVFWRKFSTGGHDGVAWGVDSDATVVADFDGDSRGDQTVIRTSGNAYVFYPLFSNGGFAGVQWGPSTSTRTPADFDGDGKTDVAVWIPGAQGQLWILRTTDSQPHVISWGTTGDIAVQGFAVK